VREIVARAVDRVVYLTDRSPSKVASLLAEWGFMGRGGKPYSDSAIHGWRNGEYSPDATVLVALALHHGLSLDELMYGGGLRSEVDRLRAAYNERGQELDQLQRDVALLARTLTTHLQLEPGPAGELDRIARPEGG
jgi:hypothetical protein